MVDDADSSFRKQGRKYKGARETGDHWELLQETDGSHTQKP